MKSPYVFDVTELLRASATMPEHRQQSGPSPSRIGPAMIAINEGEPVNVTATLTPIGSGVYVEADFSGTLTGTCVRCLKTLRSEYELHVVDTFMTEDAVIENDDVDADAHDEDEEIHRVIDNTIDLEQTIINEAVLNLPFNPTCEGGCAGDSDVPEPDGVSGDDDETIDPRWAGLEKYL